MSSPRPWARRPGREAGGLTTANPPHPPAALTSGHTPPTPAGRRGPPPGAVHRFGGRDAERPDDTPTLSVGASMNVRSQTILA